MPTHILYHGFPSVSASAFSPDLFQRSPKDRKCHLCRQIGSKLKENKGILSQGKKLTFRTIFSLHRLIFPGHFSSSNFVIYVYFQWNSVHLYLIHSHVIHQLTALSEKKIPMCLLRLPLDSRSVWNTRARWPVRNVERSRWSGFTPPLPVCTALCCLLFVLGALVVFSIIL